MLLEITKKKTTQHRKHEITSSYVLRDKGPFIKITFHSPKLQSNKREIPRASQPQQPKKPVSQVFNITCLF